jgi:Lrp/AsnC family transcriptional regulator for asnA, asnC and gidA
MAKLDPIDWEIIALLNEDGRMPSAEIARRIEGVSARTVKNRIDALVNHGVINIRSILKPEAIGYSVLADLFIETEPGRLREVAERLAELPQVSYVVCATGDTDIIISIRARTIDELYNFIIEVVDKMPGVLHTQSYLLPVSIKDNMTWLPVDMFQSSEHQVSEDPSQSTDESVSSRE